MCVGDKGGRILVSLGRLLNIFGLWFPHLANMSRPALCIRDEMKSHLKSLRTYALRKKVSISISHLLGFEDSCKMFFTFKNSSFSKCKPFLWWGRGLFQFAYISWKWKKKKRKWSCYSNINPTTASIINVERMAVPISTSRAMLAAL